MEWAGWLFSIPVVSWLIKEVWTNIAQTKLMKKQTENEHLYFKKRLIFETKNEIYKELYKRLKHMVGIMNDFQYFDERLMTGSQNAVNYHVLEVKVGDDTFNSELFVENYNNDELARLKVNINFYFNIMEKSYLEFKNYASEQNYILTREENEVIYEIDVYRNDLFEYIETSLFYTKEGVDKPMDKFRNHFGDDYANRFEKLDQLTYKFSDTIRKELLI